MALTGGKYREARADGDPAVLPDLSEAGVSELVVVGPPPGDPGDATAWVGVPAASWLV
jgi:hypothetical protein